MAETSKKKGKVAKAKTISKGKTKTKKTYF